jgi:aspartate beta-hydroxylase
VPADCGIRVGGEARTWGDGCCIIFDDSFEHEVWNESAHERIVLIVDVWHPDLSDDEVKLLDGLYRFVVARSTSGWWARRGRKTAVRFRFGHRVARSRVMVAGRHSPRSLRDALEE